MLVLNKIAVCKSFAYMYLGFEPICSFLIQINHEKFKTAIISELCIPMLLLSSCKDDGDDELTPGVSTNTATIDGKSIEFAKGYLEDYGMITGGGDLDVFLTSSGIAYNSSLGEFTGKGHAIYLDLNTSSDGALVKGVYTYKDIESEPTAERTPNTFVDASVAYNYDLNTDEGTEYADITRGTVEITEVSGTKVTMIFDITFVGGHNLKGNYTGDLEWIGQ